MAIVVAIVVAIKKVANRRWITSNWNGIGVAASFFRPLCSHDVTAPTNPSGNAAGAAEAAAAAISAILKRTERSCWWQINH